MSGADNSADRSLDLSGEDQQADADMPHAALLQMLEGDNTSDDAVNQLKLFLSTYLQRIKDVDLVRTLQGSSHAKITRGFVKSATYAAKRSCYCMGHDCLPCTTLFPTCMKRQMHHDPRSHRTSPSAVQTMRIGEHHIPAFDVWMAVLRNGGNTAVTNNKLWATIGRSVTNPPQCAPTDKNLTPPIAHVTSILISIRSPIQLRRSL